MANMKAAARVTDLHTCPLVDGLKPHVGGPITSGMPKVLLEGQPAARVTDVATCVGPPDAIASGDLTVWIGGKPAARLTDTTAHGGKIMSGCTTVYLGDPTQDDKDLAPLLAYLCPEAASRFDTLRREGWTLLAYDSGEWPDEVFNGKKWVKKPMSFGGETSQDTKTMKLNLSQDPGDNAATVFHESTHTQQPPAQPWPEKEYDAYKKEEEFRIKKGLPPHDPSFRTKDAAGNTVVNEAAIRKQIDKEYPYAATSSPAPGGAGPRIPDQIISKLPGNRVKVQRGDGSIYQRPAKRGDKIPHDLVTQPATGRPVNLNKMRCP
jgi:uncharacterized Zn-binding protein involved in type VI secretion